MYQNYTDPFVRDNFICLGDNHASSFFFNAIYVLVIKQKYRNAIYYLLAGPLGYYWANDGKTIQWMLQQMDAPGDGIIQLDKIPRHLYSFIIAG